MEFTPGTRDSLEYPGGQTIEDMRIGQMVQWLVSGFAVGPIAHHPGHESVERGAEVPIETMLLVEELSEVNGAGNIIRMRPPRFLADARGFAGETTDELMLYMVPHPAAQDNR